MSANPRRFEPSAPTFDSFVPGDVHVSYRRTVTETHLVNFTAMAGLQLPLFIDHGHAKEQSTFGGPIAPGFLTASLSAGMLESVLGTNTIAGLGMEAFRFRAPVRVGDTLHAEVEVLDKKDTREPGRGVLTVGISVRNQSGETALEYRTSVLMRR
ncbi:MULTISPECIES: MaoC family dehydratase [Ramlibacter]|uniref:Acyl dehydratase n=1 Tax=Ramlibacter pinisoli TaxID=2682844 RepID=A0A6N8IZZ5_9BURK|nr:MULTISPECIES: MaoC/PaaZ C-terminal domain-containing protein [Ramlibacter]MBA2962667.1 acyl dehydratase [Ramlibacter sp. CGMCC 1.13660]MVQ32609.1 acyl dehydratase [Ramlibacter pinisoli]